MTRFLVLGAGIIGASVAYRLAEAGHAVTVIERRYPGAGTSGASFAWTNSNEKTPYNYHHINVLGMRAHRALENEFGARPWFHTGGSVEWKSDPAEAAELAERVERLKGWNYPAEWISPRELRTLEPALLPDAAGAARIAYFPDEGWVDPVVYIDFFLEKARALGARLVRGTVCGLLMHGSAVTGVRTASGGTIEGDVVVNCTGRWANDLGQEAHLTFPLAPTLGLLVTTLPTASGVRRNVRSPGVYFRPDGAGRIMLHSEAAEEGLTLESSREEVLPIAQAMIARAARVCPGLAGTPPEGMRLTLRAIPGDGVSAVGPLPGIDGYYAVVTHSGVTLAPWLGQAVAAELTGGAPEKALADFRPARFF